MKSKRSMQPVNQRSRWAGLGGYTNQTGLLVVTNVPPAGQNAYFYRTIFP
ncbi:MAG: hypothetical protein NT154_30550 [Verrucomicrobia bacterium]|nr:hypothetical protein [Verrucomicrobiota bacterium]